MAEQQPANKQPANRRKKATSWPPAQAVVATNNTHASEQQATAKQASEQQLLSKRARNKKG
jgi:hypothetical protein